MIVCQCLKIDKETIDDYLNQRGLAVPLSDVVRDTGAGSRCRSCIEPSRNVKRDLYLKDILQEFCLRFEVQASSSPYLQLSMLEKIVLIEQIIEEKVRPILQKDQGDIVLVDVYEDEVVLEFQGECSQCPSSRGGTLQFIGQTLLGGLKEENIKVRTKNS